MPDHTQGIIPHLVVDDAASALDFYKKAFAATQVMRMPAEDGKRLLHAEVRMNGARLFLRDNFPDQCSDQGGKVSEPKALGGTPVTMHLEVADCDKTFKRAVAAGATVVMEPWDAFWGARYAQVIDPFGHAWSFAHPLQRMEPA